MSYTKLFSSIVTSTIWTEDDKTRIVWITMLALADKNGEVQASIPGLARIAGVSVSDCETAIGKFLSPDPYSRTTDDEGRRIEPIEGGWVLINHAKYREMASRDEQREAETKRKRRYREQLKRNGKLSEVVPDLSQNVPDMSPNVPKTLHIADTEAKAEEDNKNAAAPVSVESAITYGAQIGVDEGTVRHWHDTRSRDGWTIAGNNGITRPIRSWQHDLATAKSWAKPSQRKAIAPQRTKRELTSADVGL
jgi:hypothetical protein